MIEAYIQTEQIVHNWIRITEAFTRAHIHPESDDSHTNLRWNTAEHRFETRPTSIGLSLAYCPEKNSFQFFSQKNDTLFITVENTDKTVATVKREINEVLTEFGLGIEKELDNTIFRFPEVIDAEGQMNPLNMEMLKTQNKVREITNEACQLFLNAMNQNSEIRVWPHNFDTGIYCEYENGKIQQFAGYSPADTEASETPYFYNGFYVAGQKLFPDNFTTPDKGYWENKRWGGAVLPLTEFENLTPNIESIATFFTQTTKQLLAASI